MKSHRHYARWDPYNVRWKWSLKSSWPRDWPNKSCCKVYSTYWVIGKIKKSGCNKTIGMIAEINQWNSIVDLSSTATNSMFILLLCIYSSDPYLWYIAAYAHWNGWIYRTYRKGEKKRPNALQDLHHTSCRLRAFVLYRPSLFKLTAFFRFSPVFSSNHYFLFLFFIQLLHEIETRLIILISSSSNYFHKLTLMRCHIELWWIIYCL